MKKQNVKNFAVALRDLTRKKKKSEIDAITRAIVGRLGVMGQMKFLARIMTALEEVVKKEAGAQNISLRLSDAEGARRFKLKGQVSIIHDPSLIAGAVLTIGDRRVDGSLSARIRQLRRHLQRN
ncbi:F0F1 ATP synthase subunit delta [Candidatus Uhrbacteria bacterium]|nr:F0F1 ATP synthase subunit delta [Candidatus Uhrbacteria bacterium]